MACETRHTALGDDKWTVTQMSATKALELESKLAPVILQAIIPIMTRMVPGFAKTGETDADQGSAISTAIQAISQTMPPAEFAELIKGLCMDENLFRNGQRVDWERDYSGGDGVMRRYRVAWFVLEANLGDFFGSMLPAGVMARARTLFKSRMSGKESTDGSGDPASTTLRSAS